MARHVWSNDETLMALRLYMLMPFGRIHAGNPDIQALADLVGRTPAAVAMKMLNLASFDPVIRDSGRVGLTSASKLDGDIWRKFNARLNDLYWASEQAGKRLTESAPDAKLPDIIIAQQMRGPTEVIGEAPIRLVQRFFRTAVLASYDNKCAVTGIDKLELLNASHIIPWKIDENRRSDPHNGIALSALHDRAFDRGLISFDAQNRLLISDRLKQGQPNKVIRSSILDFEGKTLEVAQRFAPDPTALEYHRGKIFLTS